MSAGPSPLTHRLGGVLGVVKDVDVGADSLGGDDEVGLRHAACAVDFSRMVDLLDHRDLGPLATKPADLQRARGSSRSWVCTASSAGAGGRCAGK